jgi:hypothetical protein
LVDSDVNVPEDVRPDLSRPQCAGDGHVALKGFHFIPALDASVRIDLKVAEFAHGYCAISTEFLGRVIVARPIPAVMTLGRK